MSNKEKLLQMTEALDEAKLAPIVTFAETYLNMLDEAFDDAFCAKLAEDARNDSDKEYVSEESLLAELGLNSNDL